MRKFKEGNDQDIMDNLCELVYRRKFKTAEIVLIEFIEKTIYHHNGVSSLEKRKETLQLIYHSFNRFYHKWIKENKIDIRKELADISSLYHSNYLISHVRKIAEMDDLLYELSSFTLSQTEEIKNNLNYYKMNSL